MVFKALLGRFFAFLLVALLNQGLDNAVQQSLALMMDMDPGSSQGIKVIVFKCWSEVNGWG